MICRLFWSKQYFDRRVICYFLEKYFKSKKFSINNNKLPRFSETLVDNHHSDILMGICHKWSVDEAVNK